LRQSILFLAVLFLLSSSSIKACGYNIFGEDYRIALLNPYIIGEDYAPLFYSADRLNTTRNAKAGKDRLRNAAAWAKELGPNVSLEDVMEVLYGTTIADWVTAKEGNASSLNWENKPAWRAISQRPDILEYMLYAKGLSKSKA